MQVTGQAIIYFITKYPKILYGLKKIRYSLYKLSKKQERQIAKDVPLNSQTEMKI